MKNQTSPIPVNPSEILKKLIEALGIDTAKFSREIGNDRPDNIYKAVEGKANPSWETLIKIALRYREVNAEFLLRGTGPIFRDIPLTPDEKDALIEYLKGENSFLREVILKPPHP